MHGNFLSDFRGGQVVHVLFVCVCDSSASHGWAETCRREELMWHEPTLDTTFLHLKANKTFHGIISWSSLCLHTENWGGTKKFKCACTPTWCYRRLHSHLHTYLMLRYRGPHFYLHTCLMLRYARSQKAYICQAKSICSIAMKTRYSQRNTKIIKKRLGVWVFHFTRTSWVFKMRWSARPKIGLFWNYLSYKSLTLSCSRLSLFLFLANHHWLNHIVWISCGLCAVFIHS